MHELPSRKTSIDQIIGGQFFSSSFFKHDNSMRHRRTGSIKGQSWSKKFKKGPIKFAHHNTKKICSDLSVCGGPQPQLCGSP